MKNNIKLTAGDIIRNGYAGEENPRRDFMYLRKGTYGRGTHICKTYEGIDWQGKRVQLFMDAPIEKIGHMPEYDAFKEALKRLAESGATSNTYMEENNHDYT